MNTLPRGCLVLVLAIAPVALAQSTDETPPAATVPKPEDAQAKALREQLERETAARKAERDAAIAADIARNPDGANAQAARKAAEAEKAQAEEKQAAEEKKAADAKVPDEATVAQEKKAREEAAAQARAATAAQERAAAANKAAIAKWRASGKAAPSILVGQRADGSFTVMVDGQVSSFPTRAEAEAFAEKTRRDADTTLSY
jgi:colicin import membrane protein